MKLIKSHLLALTAVVVVSLSLVGCNTMRGIGQDVQASGKALSNASTHVQKDMRNS